MERERETISEGVKGRQTECVCVFILREIDTMDALFMHASCYTMNTPLK